MSTFSPPQQTGPAARVAIVNRTRRVVRERAMHLQRQKRTVRDLLVPCLICSAVLLSIGAAIWTLADDGVAGWDGGTWHRLLEPGGDAGFTISMLLVWFLPVSVITAAVVLLRKSRVAGLQREVRR